MNIDRKSADKLSEWIPSSGDFFEFLTPAIYTPDLLTPSFRENWLVWVNRYSKRVMEENLPPDTRTSRMKAANPKYVLRNYLAQSAITAAEAGDSSVLERLHRVLKNPYDDQPEEEDLAAQRPEWARSAPGCSALSCSS